MQRVYVYANQKGGVTKTTSAMSAAIMGWLSGKRVLLVDMDPQGNATAGMGYFPDGLEHTTYTAMLGQSTLAQTIKQTFVDPKTGTFFDWANVEARTLRGITTLEQVKRGPDLLTNNILAEAADTELHEHPTWGILLRELLAQLEGEYDEVHIDTRPSLGPLTVNALLAATHVVIPMTPEEFPQQGMVRLVHAILRAKRSNPRLSVAGIVFTRVRYATHQKIMARIREQIIPKINQENPGLDLSFFSALINEGAGYSDAAFRTSSVIIADPTGPFAVQNWAFYVELLERTGGEGVERARANYEHVRARFQQAKDEERQRKAGSGETR